MTTKQLYKIDLNWYGENHRFFLHAKKGDFALNLAILTLAKKLNISTSAIFNHIHNGFDRYLVTKIKE